ncbi:MAG TPA: hypothetical protein DD979_05650 [Gammaproteobacteria bacterium]|jgi:formylglycine-generating enzyme required for sulfatase activity|nr:hypothetical protein [Gammaproteobacteria bacterium]
MEATTTATENAAPRSRTLWVPDIAWVEIPAGEFIYGEGNEQPTLHLDAFEIARYPVTNRQYECFVDDGGYEDEQWWDGLKKTELLSCSRGLFIVRYV